VLLTSFSKCARLWMFEDANVIDVSPSTLDRVRERMVMADDILLTRITLGVKGSHMKTRYIEGEVWQ
jgi:hypothetical protein